MSAVASPSAFVLVHGWAGSAESWAPVVEVLRLQHPAARIVAVRLPGSPNSASVAANTVDAAADEVMSVLRGMPAPAVLVGHSMGAQVTLRAAIETPDHVLGEIVADPAYGADDDSHSAMATWAEEIAARGHSALDEFFGSATGPRTPAPVVERILRDLDATSSEALRTYLLSEYVDAGAIGLATATRRAASLRTRPVLALHSTEEGAAFERSLPAPAGSRVEHWPGHSHYIHLEDPERFVSAVTEWTSRLARESAVIS